MVTLTEQLAESLRLAVHRDLDELCWCNDWPSVRLTAEGERVVERVREREAAGR